MADPESPFYPISTPWQWVLTVTVVRIGGILSVTGSSIIIFMILSKRDRLKRMHNRFILCMSILDVIGSSMAWIATTALTPRSSGESHTGEEQNDYSSGYPGSMGNSATCVSQGFAYVFSLGAPGYNAMLCMYYMLVIRLEFSDVRTQKLEPLLHMYAIVPTLALAIYSAVRDLYEPRAGFCFVKESIAMKLLSSIVALDAIIMISSMYSVSRAIRKTELAMRRYDFGPRRSMTRRQSRSESNEEVYKQSIWYAIAALFTYMFPAMERLIFSVTGARSYITFLLLTNICLPLQGFWNFFIFTRPRILTIRERYPDETFLWCFREMILPSDDDTNMNTGTRMSRIIASGQNIVNRSNPTQQLNDDVDHQPQHVQLDFEDIEDEEEKEEIKPDSVQLDNQLYASNQPALENINENEASGDDNIQTSIKQISDSTEEQISNEKDTVSNTHSPVDFISPSSRIIEEDLFGFSTYSPSRAGGRESRRSSFTFPIRNLSSSPTDTPTGNNRTNRRHSSFGRSG